MKVVLMRVRSSAGYTIDQTVMIVLIIAVLVTMIILTVGWNLMTRSSGGKLAAQMQQVQQANGQFYSSYAVWPYSAYTGAQSAARNALALTGTEVSYTTLVTNRAKGTVRNFVPGLQIKNGVLQHTFTANTAAVGGPFGGPGIYMELRDLRGAYANMQGEFIVVVFNDVPLGEARQADEDIDGKNDFSTGRLVANTYGSDCYGTGPTNITASMPDTARVVVCYAGNSPH